MMPTSHLRFIAVGALAAIALAACSSSSKSAPPATTTTSAAPTSTAAPTTVAGSATTATTVPAAGGKVTVGVTTTKLGKVLVNTAGMTLYIYGKDPGNGTSKCAGQCLTIWPPATVTSTPTYGSGTPPASDFKVSATKQLVVNGFPLYTFSSDTAPGDTTGQGIGDFNVAGANGKKIG
jgi:predicted lipoprotein with Yx(FWY)xxD motif